MTKGENVRLLKERMEEIRRLQSESKGDMGTLSQWLERCRQEITAMEIDCQYPYPCLEECYCQTNGMRGDEVLSPL